MTTFGLIKTTVAAGAGIVLAAVIVLGGGFDIRKNEPIALAQTDTWTTPEAQRLGVRLLETRDASGPPAYPVAPGDVLFFTNAGTSFGAKNSKNSVVVVNARTKAPIGMSDLDPKYSAKLSSHGIGVSLDGRYTYLPAMTNIAAPANTTPEYTLVLDTRTLKIHQVLATGGVPHHAKAFRDASGRSLVLLEHFNWNTPQSAGKGFFIMDPMDHNKVIAGMSTEDLHGNPYAGFTTPDGRYLYYGVPPPNHFSFLGHDVDGWLAKVDTSSWRVVQAIPMALYPLWTVFSLDGQWAWVTNSWSDKVLKVQRATTPTGRDRVVSEIATGGGPYGLRLTRDGSEVWVADKGEGGPTGKTITIIDAQKDTVKATVETGCLRNDHIILSPDGSEMWATCNASHDIVVLDAKTKGVKHRIPMPNSGDSHGGVFVAYSRRGDELVAETVSDQNGLHGSALAAALNGVPWTPPGR